MNKRKFVEAILKPLGLEVRRRTTHEVKPWDHTFKKGVKAEVQGEDPNKAVSDAWGEPEWVKYITPHLREDMTVCEIGPGVGRWTNHVIDKASTLYLVDYSKYVCDYWEKKQNPAFKVIQSMNTRLPQISDQSVDLFMSFDVFVHLDIEPFYGYLEEAYRVLKPGGVALIDYLSIDDSVSADWFIKELDKQSAYGQSDEVKRSIFRIHHNETIRVLAEAIGFSFANIEDDWKMHNICTLTKSA